MKRVWMLMILIILAMVFSGTFQVRAAELAHNYELNGNFLDELGGPALTPNGSGYLVDGGYMVPDHDSGLSLRNVIHPSDYSIEMLVRLDGFPTPDQCVSGDQVCSAKIVDFKDLSADDGLYTPTSDGISTDGRLQICCAIGVDSSEGAITYGELIHLILTRDGASDQVVGYINGLPVISIQDDVNLTVFDTQDNVVHFLMDDTEFVDDPPLGFIERIRIYDGALTPEEVRSLSDVNVDIKPGSDPNSINCENEKEVITVAVQTTDEFDALTIDHTTLSFEGAAETHVYKNSGEPKKHVEDVDGDGDMDLVSHFRLGDTDLSCDSTEGTLLGETIYGMPIEGRDSLRMVVKEMCLAPPDGLVSWWPGDGNANDIVNQHHGTMDNGATFSPGIVGQAFSFDGEDYRVTIPDHDDWTLGDDPFTIDLWVNFSMVYDRSPFVDHTEGPGETNKWWFMYDAWGHDKPSGPALRFHINSPTLPPLDAIYAPWEPNAGQWYHVAVTRNGSNYALYIDGALVSIDTNDTTIPDAETSLFIGQSEEQYFLHGLIDEVEIYDRALTPGEIESIYLAGSAGKCKDG